MEQHAGAQRLRELLGLAGISAREMSRRLGVNSMWTSDRLRGAASISLDDLERLCRVLEITPAEFHTPGIPARYRAAALMAEGLTDEDVAVLTFVREVAPILGPRPDDAPTPDPARAPSPAELAFVQQLSQQALALHRGLFDPADEKQPAPQ